MFKVLQRATNTFNTSDSSVNRLSKNIFSALHIVEKRDTFCCAFSGSRCLLKMKWMLKFQWGSSVLSRKMSTDQDGCWEPNRVRQKGLTSFSVSKRGYLDAEKVT